MATIRQIIDKIGEQYLDAELSVAVSDGHLNYAKMLVPLEFHTFPRTEAYPQTNEPARLTISLSLPEHRLVKNSAKKVA